MPSTRPSLKAALTRRSSPEWNDRIATRPPGFRQAGRPSEQGIERAELVVDGDPERLEDPADRVVGAPPE